MTKISILLPTRGRPDIVSRLFESILATTAKPQEIEIVLYIDEDDIASQEIPPPDLKLIKLIKPPGNTMGKITRECYQASSGHYLLLMNDDALFRTPGWDLAVLEAFAQFPDDIALVYGNDLDQGERVPTFPIVSRKTCELIGGVCPSEYLNLHIESHLLDIFKQLKRLGHQRIIYLDKVVFEHLHYVLGKSEYDETYVKKDLGFDDWVFVSFADERSYLAKKVAAYIEGYENGQNDTVKKKIVDRKILPVKSQQIVSVIITDFYPSTGNDNTFLDTIINNSKTPLPVEILIAGNGSNDSIPENLAGQIKIIYNKEQFGFSSNCNKCAQEAKGDYLVFISNNALPMPGWLDALVSAVKTEDDAAIVGCKSLEPRNGRIQHAGISFYENSDGLKATYTYKGFEANHPAVNKLQKFQAVSATCMLVNKKLFLEVGGFDENLAAMKDIDLCIKIKQRGGKIIYTPKATINYYGELPNLYPLASNWNGKLENDLDEILQRDGFCRRKVGGQYHIYPISPPD